MNYRTGYLGLILSSTMLIACGGGGGGDPSGLPAVGGTDPTNSSSVGSTGPNNSSSVGGTAPTNSSSVGGTAPNNAPAAVSVANPELAKYAGNWRKDCVDHMRLTMTATATVTNTFSVTKNEEHFANADCTGAIVAIGNYGVPDETVQYNTAPLENASVQMLDGTTIVANVDPGSSVSANATFNFTGSGVLTTEFVLGTTFARIKYAEKEVVLSRGALSGKSTSGALLLLNGELLSLVPIENSASSFRVNHRFIRVD